MSASDEESKDQWNETNLQCPECLAGIMRMNHITYFTWLNDELVTVPNFPAWICDVCGRRSFDPRAIAWLNALLSPSAGRPARSARGKKTPATPSPPQP